jgi:hypothetical protein
MLWFFERGEQRLQCEIRPASDRTGFELVWTAPDGQIHVQHSDDAAVLTQRLQQLQEHLEVEGWKRVGRVTPTKPFL